MTDLELRKKHNEEAIKAVTAVRTQMYPGMLLSVEADEDCLRGKGIVATTDDIFSMIPEQFKYNPHMMAKSKANGDVEELGAADIKKPQQSRVEPKPVMARSTEQGFKAKRSLSELL